jgi:glycosyltransferase involved in cell wall biosynthesis
MISISIVIPAYNEEKRVGLCLETLHAYCIEKKWDFELIVVEDGSSDNTARIVNEFHSKDNRINLLSLPIRLGKGGAISAAALLHVTKQYMAYVDVDLAAEPSQLERMILHLGDHDVVIGSRILRGNLPAVSRPFHREFFSRSYSRLFRTLFRIPVYDPQCGFKVFRSSVLPKLLRKITVSGFAFDTELIITAYSYGMRIKEIPITWVHGKSSSVNVLYEVRSMGLDLLSIWYNYHLRWKQNDICYPQKKGTILGRLIFAFLSHMLWVKTRHQKYLDYRNFLSELPINTRSNFTESIKTIQQ